MSKEEAIKILRHWGNNTPATDRDCAVKMAIEALENPEPHWIPVTERLPETNDEVLTTYIVNGDRNKKYVETASYYQSSESWYSVWDEFRVAGTRIEVIAWQPLPEPYKGVTS